MSTLVLHLKKEKLSLVSKFNAATNLLQVWADRYEQRKQLARLSPHMLADIGIDPVTAAIEIRKPFWK